MNDNAKLWVKQLRSGQYRQGQGWLHTREENGVDSFCCLGVACDLYQRQTGDQIGAPSGQPWEGKVIAYDGQEAHLPDKVKNWLGLSTEAGTFVVAKCPDSLIDMNDGGSDFNEIADIIESEPEGLFDES